MKRRVFLFSTAVFVVIFFTMHMVVDQMAQPNADNVAQAQVRSCNLNRIKTSYHHLIASMPPHSWLCDTCIIYVYHVFFHGEQMQDNS